MHFRGLAPHQTAGVSVVRLKQNNTMGSGADIRDGSGVDAESQLSPEQLNESGPLLHLLYLLVLERALQYIPSQMSDN